mmetsp:Transcript_2838/g.11260  ORF Transcript_2838/g.11260 Transcript_2838/m.11260 type:complete len:422 (-) Transcript_2838:114-1379(-)
MSAKDVHVTRVSADPTSPGPGATLANSKHPSSDAKHVTLAPAHAPRTEAPSREKPRPTTFFFASNAPRRRHERDNRGGPVRRHVGGSETSSRVSSCFSSSSSCFPPDEKAVSGEKASSFVSPGPLKKVASSSPRRAFSSPREGDPFVSSATAAGARTSSSETSSRPVSSPSSFFVFVSVTVRSFSKKGSSVASRVAASVARTSRARSAAPRSRVSVSVLFSRRAIHFSRAFFASRGGCGCAKSLFGALPNSWICASNARRCTGSLVASSELSAAPWYVRGWNALSAFSACGPVCLYPKTRSIHLWIDKLTGSLSSASRCFRMNTSGDPCAQGGSTTSPNASPSTCLIPRFNERLFTRKSLGPQKNSGTSSLTSAVERSAPSNAFSTPWNKRSGASNAPFCKRRWCFGSLRKSQYSTYPGAL